MYPYINLGAVSVNTYGVALIFGFSVAWYALRANMSRHGIPSQKADVVILTLLLAGLTGSKFYHELETPWRLLAHPWGIFSSTGFAWSGGLLAGLGALSAVALCQKTPPLALMDLASPPAAIGYAVGRLGCLLAGDGDYGVPTSLPWGMSFPGGIVPIYTHVHPTPIYESAAAILIFCYLWRASRGESRAGSILARYLILSGAARFLVEFIRINPRSFFGLTNAQALSVLCIVAGMLLLLRSGEAEPTSTTLLTNPTKKRRLA